MVLADLGADVIRVDRPGGQFGPGGPHDFLTRGRPNVALDLKHPDAVATVLRLVESADVLVEGLRPGVTERLGLGPDDCLARNPRLVYGRMTGWGQTGPLAQTAGHDLDYLAVAGALYGLGQDPARPHFPANLLGDFGGGSTYLVVGILAALVQARRPARGRSSTPRSWTASPTSTPCTPATSPPAWRRSAATRTCSTAGRRSTTSTRPRTAATWRSAPWSRSSTTALVDGLGIRGPRPDRDDPATSGRRCATLIADDRARPPPRRVGRGLRRDRRLRRPRC